jgi:hypothetical protein
LAERAQSTTLAIEYLGDNLWWICRVEPGEVLADEVVTHSRAVERVEEESQELLSLASPHGGQVPPSVYLIGDRQIDTMSLSRLRDYIKLKSPADIFDGAAPDAAAIRHTPATWHGRFARKRHAKKRSVRLQSCAKPKPPASRRWARSARCRR